MRFQLNVRHCMLGVVYVALSPSVTKAIRGEEGGCLHCMDLTDQWSFMLMRLGFGCAMIGGAGLLASFALAASLPNLNHEWDSALRRVSRAVGVMGAAVAVLCWLRLAGILP